MYVAASADPGALRLPGLQPHPFADSPPLLWPGQCRRPRPGLGSPAIQPHPRATLLEPRVTPTRPSSSGNFKHDNRSSALECFLSERRARGLTARCLCLERRAPSSATRAICLDVRARTLERRAPRLTRESASTRLSGSEGRTRRVELHTPSCESRARGSDCGAPSSRDETPSRRHKRTGHRRGKGNGGESGGLPPITDDNMPYHPSRKSTGFSLGACDFRYQAIASDPTNHCWVGRWDAS